MTSLGSDRSLSTARGLPLRGLPLRAHGASFDRPRAITLGRLALVGLGALGLVACSGGESATETPSTTPTPTANPAPEAPPTAPPAEARAVWDEPSFELRSNTPGPYGAGQEGHFEIRLAARGNFHVNQDYPISIQVTAPDGVTLPRATLGRPEAAEFSEALARFDVPFTAAAGAHRLTALVDFAVCTPENCMPDTRTIEIPIAVQ